MTRTTRLLTAAGLTVAALLIAACGGGSGPAPAAQDAEGLTATPQPAAATAPAETQELREPAASEDAATESSETAATGRPADAKLAPELSGISGWINSEPFTLESQRGNVVLIDFWTYTCINCIRTMPYLRDWQEKYADQGLVIVGVHTPEFEFEKLTENVIEATQKHELKYAVAQDNDYETWDAFNNRFWPAKYLIDKDGYIRYQHFGEGSYDETEAKIRELLLETGAAIDGIDINQAPEPEIDPLSRNDNVLTSLTRELYAGYERNYSARFGGGTPPYVVQSTFYQKIDTDALYDDPGEHVNHFMYLQGLWHNGAESLTHARVTEDLEDYITILFFARSVNVVMLSEDGDPYQVRVTIDGEPVKPDEAGADITYDDDGNSLVLVDKARMYRVVKIPEFASHELRLSSNSDDFSVFAYTFGAYKAETES